MAKDLLLPGSILSLHRSAVEKLLKAGNGDAALLYLCLTAGQNSGALPWGPDQVEAAQNTLPGWASSPRTPRFSPPAGKAGGRPAPDYTTQDIAQAFQNDGGFKALVPAVEQMLGKVLSPADLKILYTLFDFLALPPEVILTLTGWCVEQAKQKGPGRKPTLTQIRREAYKWQKAGIDTLEAADAHLHRLSRRNRRGRRSSSSSSGRAGRRWRRRRNFWTPGFRWAAPTSCCCWPGTGPSSSFRSSSGPI